MHTQVRLLEGILQTVTRANADTNSSTHHPEAHMHKHEHRHPSHHATAACPVCGSLHPVSNNSQECPLAAAFKHLPTDPAAVLSALAGPLVPLRLTSHSPTAVYAPRKGEEWPVLLLRVHALLHRLFRPFQPVLHPRVSRQITDPDSLISNSTAAPATGAEAGGITARCPSALMFQKRYTCRQQKHHGNALVCALSLMLLLVLMSVHSHTCVNGLY
jgi:hypothetical protein